jgi:hypothetical protein
MAEKTMAPPFSSERLKLSYYESPSFVNSFFNEFWNVLCVWQGTDLCGEERPLTRKDPSFLDQRTFVIARTTETAPESLGTDGATVS